MSPFNAKDFLGALSNHATTKDRGNKNKHQTTPYLQNGRLDYISPRRQEQKGGPFTPLLDFSLVAWKFYS
jgi:hypothetical protein